MNSKRKFETLMYYRGLAVMYITGSCMSYQPAELWCKCGWKSHYLRQFIWYEYSYEQQLLHIGCCAEYSQLH